MDAGREADMEINRKKAADAFTDYLSRFEPDDVKIRLKADHTWRVAGLCEKIARSLSLSEDDTDLAWLLGILHDLGHFVQVERYGTFNDRLSANHAALSGDLLFREGKIRDYIDDDTEDALIEKAVRLHNVFHLPEGLSERERMFADILRDGDKVDILKVNCDTPLSDIYDVSEEAFRQAEISPEVMEDVRHCRLVDLHHASTCMDEYTAHICFVFGLVYPESIRETGRQGYLEQMMSFQSDNEKTQKDLKEIRNCVHAWMKRKTAEEVQ
jgi:hypothetical protein